MKAQVQIKKEKTTLSGAPAVKLDFLYGSTVVINHHLVRRGLPGFAAFTRKQAQRLIQALQWKKI